MLKRILMTIVLAGSIGGAIAACNSSGTPAPSLSVPSAEASTPAESTGAGSSAGSSEAAPSVEASPASS